MHGCNVTHGGALDNTLRGAWRWWELKHVPLKVVFDVVVYRKLLMKQV